jgi:hypothetical protein
MKKGSSMPDVVESVPTVEPVVEKTMALLESVAPCVTLGSYIALKKLPKTMNGPLTLLVHGDTRARPIASWDSLVATLNKSGA